MRSLLMCQTDVFEHKLAEEIVLICTADYVCVAKEACEHSD
jgi:hypothetical protein